MASPGLSELVTSTLRNRSGKLADNVTKSNAALYKMEQKGSVESTSGGRTIVQELEYAENAGAQRYSGGETLSLAQGEIMTAAEFDWKQIAIPVQFHGLESDVQNVGDDSVIKLVASRIKNAEKTGRNMLGSDIYSDGTASSGKQIGGFQLLVADDPTSGTVGGINCALTGNTWWRNKNFDISVSGSGAASSTNIQGYMETLWLRLIRGTDRPDLIMSANDYFSLFWASCQASQRFVDEDMAKAGFKNLQFNGAPVVPDGGGSAAQGGACPDSHMYFLNTDTTKLRYAKNRNWKPLETVQSISADAFVKFIVWAGNATSSNRSLNGVLNA